MTPTTKLVYDTRRKVRANNAGTTAHRPLVDIIAAINQAQEVWFTSLVPYAERDSKVRDDLRVFERKDTALALEQSGPLSNRYALPDDLYKRLNQYATACRQECCGDLTKKIIIRYVHPDHLNEARANPYRTASFEYEQLTGDEAGHSLYVHHEGNMEIKEVFIDYYVRPGPLHAPSLIKCADATQRYYDYEGRPITQDTNFLPQGRFVDNLITDLAAIILADSGEDYQKLQAKIQSVMALPQIAQS